MVTIGTNSRIVIYQHLFAQICILEQDTIGYKRYNFVKNVKKASNTNEIGGRAHDFYIYLLLIQKGVYRNS